MYVVAVLDDGEQRTYLSEDLKVLDRVVHITVYGTPRQIPLSDILDIVPVESAPIRPSMTAMHATRQ